VTQRESSLVGLAIACVVMGGCWQQGPRVPPIPPTPSPFPALGISTQDFPRVDGSTSTLPLARVIACKILDAPYHWQHSEKDDTRHLFASDLYYDLAQPEYRGEKKDLCDYINYWIDHKGTHEAYVNLIQRRADLILVARRPSADELQLAGGASVELEIRPVALDAFVFLLNSRNAVSSLTTAQLRDIYSGKIANWREVGGENAVITPYQRSRNSGSQELMQSLVMKDRKMIKAPELLTGTLMSSPFLAIDDDERGIGYSVYYYQEFMSPPTAVKACAVEGFAPTPDNIRSRVYPLVTDVLLVIRRDLAVDHPARRLSEWLLTPEGQEIVAESGYVPIVAPVQPADNR
jgi:ABC-type phosphate transport system substrate-binding protein